LQLKSCLNKRMNSPLRIVFYGTPEFAAYSLKQIHQSGFQIIAVVTAPDKPAGRGLAVQSSAVKKMAEELSLHVLQPSNLKSESFLSELKTLNPDVQVVIAFRMLPETVWALPSKGTFNLHASLLPQYRGAAPINHAIINGEKETGVTTFFIEKELDTGKIILQSKVEITNQDNAGTLHDKLMFEGADLVNKTLIQIQNNTVRSSTQSVDGIVLKAAPKIFPQDCYINWEQNASAIYNFVRGLAPYPVARTQHNDKIFKVYATALSETASIPTLSPGEWSITNKQLLVGCADQNILITEIQQEGKKRMKIADFLLGYRD